MYVRDRDAQYFGQNVNDVALAVGTAMPGQKASYLLEGDRLVHIWVGINIDTTGQMTDLCELRLRSLGGRNMKLSPGDGPRDRTRIVRIAPRRFAATGGDFRTT